MSKKYLLLIKIIAGETSIRKIIVLSFKLFLVDCWMFMLSIVNNLLRMPFVRWRNNIWNVRKKESYFQESKHITWRKYTNDVIRVFFGVKKTEPQHSFSFFQLIRSLFSILWKLLIFEEGTSGTGQYLWEYGTGKWEIAGAKIYPGPVDVTISNSAWPRIQLV